jgi:hypothetical protein
MTRKAWTPQDDARLVAMRTQGYGFEAIALVIGHSADGCKVRARILGAYKGGPGSEPAAAKAGGPTLRRDPNCSPTSDAKTKGKWRWCLCCKKKFWSTGPGNRLCGNCRQISVSPLAMPSRVLR